MDVQESAKKIVHRFIEAGYVAYYAGGWVRDYLMGHPSADIDIATNAPPEKIVELFRKTISVGINFGVVVVVLDGHQFEVSTFRRDIDYKDGRRPSEIALSTPKEDALRRDFTINGMFYDPFEEKVIDYVNGQEDITKGIIRTIGDPEERFVEDRLRMIRAVRFAARFGFSIDEGTRRAIKKNAKTLFPAVAMERIWQELKKMAESSRFQEAILDLYELGLLAVIFPALKDIGIDELKKRIFSFSYFPKKAPAILYVMELFPKATLEQEVEVCKYLKVSNKNLKLVELAHRAQRLVQGCKDVDWARYYANPLSMLCLGVVAARLTPEERESFLQEHRDLRQRLQPHIDRVISNKPLVTSEDLKREGIAPGRKMGKLLDEAERIAVNDDLQDREQVIARLKESPNWKKES